MDYNFKNLSVLIVEDEVISRTSLQEALAFSFKHVYAAQDGCSGLEMLKQYNPDIVLSDINMPCIDGYDLVKMAKAQHFSPIFIFISAHGDSDYMTNAIDVKIDAYIIKPINIDVLKKKIIVLLNDRDQNNHLKELAHTTLSDREYEVFLDIAKGIMPRVIASKYNVKPKTVSTYRQRIFEKMNMNSNSDIIRYAIKNDLI